jgi:hypothetical protein
MLKKRGDALGSSGQGGAAKATCDKWRDRAKFLHRARHAVPLLTNSGFDLWQDASLDVEGVAGFVLADLVAEVVVDGV